MHDNNLRLVGEHGVDFVDERHLFDGVERAGHEALTAAQAALVVDLVLGTESADDGVRRANLAAGVAGFAQILVDFDDAAQFTLADGADKIRAVFAAAVGRRVERLDSDGLSSHVDGSPV